MSVRQRATQFIGKQLFDQPHSPQCSPTCRRAGHQGRWHEEKDVSKLVPTSGSPVCAASERTLRSRETVRAWLESSPTSVLESLDDESACPSSSGSFHYSPADSDVDHVSYTTRFQVPASRNNAPGQAKSRTISPPRCRANRNSVDLSRIDPVHYNGSFLMLAFKNAQYHGSSSPPEFRQMSTAGGDEIMQSLNAEECNSPGSDFSLTSEWQNMLAACNVAGMSARDSSGNNSEFETLGEALNISDLDLDSAVPNFHATQQVARKTHRRTRSMEVPCIRDHSARDGLRYALIDDSKHVRAAARLEQGQPNAGVRREQGPLRKLSRRNSMSFTSSRDSFGERDKRKVRSIAAAWEEGECGKLVSRCGEEVDIKSWKDYQREEAISNMKRAELNLEAKPAHLMEKVQDETTKDRCRAEEMHAITKAKGSGKAARAVLQAKLIRRTARIPRGCLFLVS